jgi:hypothetical protein
MKSSRYLLLGFTLLFYSACDILNIRNPDDTAKLFCIGSYTFGSVTRDSVFFTEDNIKWFDTTTNQLRLNDSLKLNDLKYFSNFKFYLGTDSLFTARLATDIMSSIVDDLVLHFNYRDGNVYLEDGYPLQFNDSLRTANKEKRTANRTRFIERLEKDGKIQR